MQKQTFVRRSLWATFVAAIAVCGACTPNGGGGGGPGGGTACCADGDFEPAQSFDGSDAVPQVLYQRTHLQARVELPAGVSVGVADLSVRTDQGDSPIAGDGKSTVDANGFEIYIVSVVNADGDTVLLGTISNLSTPRVINAKSTAVVLLYFALGGWTVDKNTGYSVQSALEFQMPDILDPLVAAIEQAMARNLTAVAAGDASITAALETAVAALETRAAAESKTVYELLGGSAARTLAVDPFVTFTPDSSTRQSGAVLRENTAGLGYILVNSVPRRGSLEIYETGYTDNTGTRHDLSPPQRLGDPLEVAAAGDIEDSGFDLVEAVNGQSQYREVSPESFTLLAHDNAVETFYDILLIGPSIDLAMTSPLLFGEDYFSQSTGWAADMTRLRQQAFIADLVVPLSETLALGYPLAMPTETARAAADALWQIVEPVLAASGNELKTTDEFTAGCIAILEKFRDDDAFRDEYMSTLLAAYGPTNAAVIDFFAVETNLLTALNTFGLEAAIQRAMRRNSDLGGAIHALHNAKDIERWEAVVATVRLTPKEAVVSRDQSETTLSAETVEEASNICYRWSTSGGPGSLNEIQGSQSGESFDSAEAGVRYFVPPNDVNDGTIDTITVQAYIITEGDTSDCAAAIPSGTLLGSATATVVGDTAPNACEDASDFDPAWYQIGGALNVSATSTVLPGETMTVTVSYSGEGPANAQANTQVVARVRLPLACGYCATPDRRCSCTQEDKELVKIDGVPITASGQFIDEADFILLGGAQTGPRDMALTCIITVNLGVGYLNPTGDNPPAGGSHTITYRISPDWDPCRSDQPNCYCPFASFITEDEIPAWIVNGVYADGTGGSDLAVFNIGVDPQYDPTIDRCDE
jgi:hypothetical protein